MRTESVRINGLPKIKIDGKLFEPLIYKVAYGQSLPASLGGLFNIYADAPSNADFSRVDDEIERILQEKNRFVALSFCIKPSQTDCAEKIKAAIAHAEGKFGSSIFAYFIEYMSNEQPNSVIAEESFDFHATQQKHVGANRIARDILDIALNAQEILKHQKLVGVLFGNILDSTQPALTAQLAYEKVFLSPDIDIIISPAAREAKSAGTFSVAIDTLIKHNKLHILNCSFSNVDTNDVSEQLLRDFMLCASKGSAMSIENLDFERCLKSFAMLDKLFDCVSDIPCTSASEIAVFSEGDSLCSINDASTTANYCLGKMRGGLSRLGAPYDSFSICDLPDIDFAQYKFVIFLNQFEISEQNRRFIEEKIKCDGRCVLFIYAAGYVSNGNAVLSEMQAITDINMKKLIGEENAVLTQIGLLTYDSLAEPLFFIEDTDTIPLGVYPNTELTAIAYKKLCNCTSCYSSVGYLPAALLRKIAQLASVHIYSDSEKAVLVNSSFIAVSADDEISLELPYEAELCNLLNGETLKTKNKRIIIAKGKSHEKLFRIKRK